MLIKIQLLRSDLVLCVGEDRRNGRNREKERERLRGIELQKTLGRTKSSGEVWKYKEWSLFVVVYFFVITLCIYQGSGL